MLSFTGRNAIDVAKHIDRSHVVRTIGKNDAARVWDDLDIAEVNQVAQFEPRPCLGWSHSYDGRG